MQKQSENVQTNHIIVDEKSESAKEKCEVRSLKEAQTFVTDNRKTRLKKSKTYAKVFQSSQAQNYSCSGKNVMNLESIKKDLNCEDLSIISASPPAIAYKCNSLSLKSA